MIIIPGIHIYIYIIPYMGKLWEYIYMIIIPLKYIFINMSSHIMTVIYCDALNAVIIPSQVTSCGLHRFFDIVN